MKLKAVKFTLLNEKGRKLVTPAAYVLNVLIYALAGVS